MDDELAKVYAAIRAVEDSGTETLDFGRIYDAVAAYAATVGGRTVDEVRVACQHPARLEVTTYSDRGHRRRAYWCEACWSKWFVPDPTS